MYSLILLEQAKERVNLALKKFIHSELKKKIAKKVREDEALPISRNCSRQWQKYML